jgi:hypothetical protein
MATTAPPPYEEPKYTGVVPGASIGATAYAVPPPAIPGYGPSAPSAGMGYISPPHIPNPAVVKRNQQLESLDKFLRHEMPYEAFISNFQMPQRIDSPLYAKCLGHGINPRYWPMLNVGKIFDFTFIYDNSGSMASVINNKELPATHRTRQGELHYNTIRSLDIISSLDDDGFDLYTLNSINTTGSVPSADSDFYGSRFVGVNSADVASRIFSERVHGATPLGEAIRAAVTDHRAKYMDPTTGNIRKDVPYKPLILIVSTDGAPTNRTIFYDMVKKRNRNEVFFNFIICSDNQDDADYLNSLDHGASLRNVLENGRNKIDGVEVIDDYETEKKQVLRIQGESFGYTRGDHEARKIISCIFPNLDKIDEMHLPDLKTPGDDYIPPDVAAVIVELASDNKAYYKRMQEYAKEHPDIARYMLDVSRPNSNTPPVRSGSNCGCCTIM